MKLWRFFFAISLVIALGSAANAENPLDLFANVPKLGDGYIRIGARNLRHINVQAGAHYFLTGVTEEADSEILTKTFAKVISDLGLDIVAITAEQHRAQEIFTRHDVVPTNVVDYPVATSEQAAQVLGGFLADGRCEIGAHLHPWVTPRTRNRSTRSSPIRAISPLIWNVKSSRSCRRQSRTSHAKPSE